MVLCTAHRDDAVGCDLIVLMYEQAEMYDSPHKQRNLCVAITQAKSGLSADKSFGPLDYPYAVSELSESRREVIQSRMAIFDRHCMMGWMAGVMWDMMVICTNRFEGHRMMGWMAGVAPEDIA